MARICTVKDVSLRPESIEALRRRLAGGRRLRRIVSFLAALVMALAAMVAVSLFVRSHQDAEEAEGREQTDDHQAARQEDNQVIDYHLWDRR